MAPPPPPPRLPAARREPPPPRERTSQPPAAPPATAADAATTTPRPPTPPAAAAPSAHAEPAVKDGASADVTEGQGATDHGEAETEDGDLEDIPLPEEGGGEVSAPTSTAVPAGTDADDDDLDDIPLPDDEDGGTDPCDLPFSCSVLQQHFHARRPCRPFFHHAASAAPGLGAPTMPPMPPPGFFPGAVSNTTLFDICSCKLNPFTRLNASSLHPHTQTSRLGHRQACRRRRTGPCCRRCRPCGTCSQWRWLTVAPRCVCRPCRLCRRLRAVWGCCRRPCHRR